MSTDHSAVPPAAPERRWVMRELDALHLMSVAIGAAYTHVPDAAKRLKLSLTPLAAGAHLQPWSLPEQRVATVNRATTLQFEGRHWLMGDADLRQMLNVPADSSDADLLAAANRRWSPIHVELWATPATGLTA